MEELAVRRTRPALVVVLLLLPPAARAEVVVQAYELPKGGGPHDVAVGADGVVWYTAQRAGQLGRLDPATGKVELIPLGAGAAPHGVIVGPDGAPWVTEGGTNAIVRVDPQTRAVRRWPLPEARGYANLNTLTFDKRGRVWFTGQSGVYGRLDRNSAARLCRLCGRQGHGLALRLGGQRDGPLRPGDREVPGVSERARRRERAPDPRAPRRGVGAGVRRRSARRLSHEVTP